MNPNPFPHRALVVTLSVDEGVAAAPVREEVEDELRVEERDTDTVLERVTDPGWPAQVPNPLLHPTPQYASEPPQYPY